jgi:hypothetical protein
MKTKHKFVPGQVVPMEERALLSGFHFPFPTKPNPFHGNLVLTSRAYQNLQTQVNRAIVTFESQVTRLFNREGGFTDTFFAKVGVGTLGEGPAPLSFASGTLLARLDATLGHLEFKLPFGGGEGVNNRTGGSGLSNKTALTSLNPAEVALGGSPAELMETAIGFATTSGELTSGMETVRTDTLAFSITTGSTNEGILPSYVHAFGGPGATVSEEFGIRNT